MTVRRRAVRVLLLDPRDRILLLQSFDPGNPARGRFWYTLGGGAEDGEPPETTARREVAEEVGIRHFELGPLVWRRRTVFEFQGVRIDQDNDYYLGRTASTAVDFSGMEPIERRTTAGHCWWTADALRGTGQTVYPTGLGDLLAGLLRDGPPEQPIVLTPE